MTKELLIRPTQKKKKKKYKTKQILSITKKKKKCRLLKKKLEGPNLTPSTGRVQAAREGPKKQSYLKFLTKKMAQIFIILYLIPDTVR